MQDKNMDTLLQKAEAYLFIDVTVQILRLFLKMKRLVS